MTTPVLPVLTVFRELHGNLQEVGHIESAKSSVFFTYSPTYLQSPDARAISHALPIQESTLSADATKSFFEGILPEGSIRRSLSAIYHSNIDDTSAFIARLNNESVGALVFKSENEQADCERSYRPLDEGDLLRFAKSPQEFASQAATHSRLSLAGAQLKAGLYFDEDVQTWFYPLGTAPSSHIVKACDGSFPGQTVNEAICMKTAQELGFDVAECRLIDVDGWLEQVPGQIPVPANEPLIAVKRFDRVNAGDAFLHRVHQEDFFQALPQFFEKYEPTDGNYANHCACLIAKESANPFGDKRFMFSRLLLDWAIGNADNHLKNHSFLWNADWSKKELSPLYDITCTTIYADIDREMGVSFGGSRRIDNVSRNMVVATATACGVGKRFAENELENLLDGFLPALHKSVEAICNQGFHQAEDLGKRIEESFVQRRKIMR